MISFISVFLVLTCVNADLSSTEKPTPVVLWHGMGDTCCNPDSIGYFADLIRRAIPNIYILSVQIGKSSFEDTLNGFISDSNEKVRFACEQIRKDHNLANGYNAIGFSQGSQFLRAVAQRCTEPTMKKLISIGGQHQGVYGVPFCSSGLFCHLLRKTISFFAYFRIIQNNFVQASYWHDPLDESTYKSYSQFLADINQERGLNVQYRLNILKLKALVLVKFLQDEMVEPMESQWFGFYKQNDLNKIYKMEESPLYYNDTLGLRTLDETGRLFKLSVNSTHLMMDTRWFINQIVYSFLI